MALFLILFAHILILLPILGVPGIGSSTEAREAQVIDLICRNGDWILPLRNGLIPSKPPLFHWFGALLAGCGGEISPFYARLASFFSGMLILIATYTNSLFLARLSERAKTREGASLIAAVAVSILTLTYGFHRLLTQSMVDMTAAAAVSIALSVLLLGTQRLLGEVRVSPIALIAFWSLAGVGILARGPVALVVAGLSAAAILWPLIGLKKTIWQLSWGWPLALLVAFPWYYAAYQTAGGAFLERQLFFENLKRFAGGDNVNSEVFWFYLPSLFHSTFLWAPILGYLWFSCWRKKRLPPFGSEWVPVICVALLTLFFSLSSGKRHSYLLPVFPWIAIGVGFLFFDYWSSTSAAERIRIKKINSWICWIVASLLVLSIAALEAVRIGIPNQSAEFLLVVSWLRPHLTILQVVLLSGLILVAVLSKTGLAPIVGFFGLLSVWHQIGLGAKHELKGFEQSTQRIVDQVGDLQLHIVRSQFDEWFDPIIFYYRRPVVLLTPDLRELPCNVPILARRTWWAEAPVSQCQLIEQLPAENWPAEVAAERRLVLFRCRCNSHAAGL
jgi:4-amino-4-deoxy-L-arabinose transferase-like glycosyltransferase